MSIDTNKLNETEIICPSELSSDENNVHNDSIEKSLLETKYSSLNKSNALINALKEFSVRYDLDDRKIMNSKRFILSFDDLISVIKFALEFQIKISNSLSLKDYLSDITQDFINNLSYYIFSYEKIDTSKSSQNIQNNQNNYYTNYNTYNNNGNNKKFNKQLNQTQTFACYGERKKRKNEVDTSFISRNKSKNEYIINTKSYFKPNNKNNKLSSNNRKARDKKKEEINNKNIANKSIEKRKSSIITDFDFIEDNNRKKNPNKSTEKRRVIKNGNASDYKRKSLNIYTACENLRGTSSILKSTRSRRLSCEEQSNNQTFISSYKTNTKRFDKIGYYDQNMNTGVKKQIINNSVIRPSNMANKLLQRGIKYITDFKDLKEEESKSKRRHQH